MPRHLVLPQLQVASASQEEGASVALQVGLLCLGYAGSSHRVARWRPRALEQVLATQSHPLASLPSQCPSF